MSAGPSSMLFRRMTLALALVLACQAIWLLIAEFCRPSYPRFPVDAKTAELVAGKRNDAALAASFGVMRGDLWTEYSLTYLNLFWSDGQGGTKQNLTNSLIPQAATAAMARTTPVTRIGSGRARKTPM